MAAQWDALTIRCTAALWDAFITSCTAALWDAAAISISKPHNDKYKHIGVGMGISGWLQPILSAAVFCYRFCCRGTIVCGAKLA